MISSLDQDGYSCKAGHTMVKYNSFSLIASLQESYSNVQHMGNGLLTLFRSMSMTIVWLKINLFRRDCPTFTRALLPG